MNSMLRVEDLESGYGPMQVLWKPSLKVEKGSITSLLGPTELENRRCCEPC